MKLSTAPSASTERMWLAQGLQADMLRHETAIAIMSILDNPAPPNE